jgi:integrase
LANIRAQDRTVAGHDADLAEALAYTGLRINEANQLLVAHVNLNVPCLTLGKEIVKGKRKGRTVPLVPAAVVLFTRLVANALPDGRIFRSVQINRGIRLACEAVKCETLTHHSFRHWFATLAREKTGDAKQVADWLGHSDGGKLVWALYSHLRTDRTAELAKKLDFDWGTPTVVTE